MLQAAFLDCQFLDFLPFSDDGFIAAKVNIGRRDVVEALVVSLIVIIFDESPDLLLQIAWKVVVFQQDAVFHGLVPPLYFALGLGMERCAADVFHTFVHQPIGQITRDVA